MKFRVVTTKFKTLICVSALALMCAGCDVEEPIGPAPEPSQGPGGPAGLTKVEASKVMLKGTPAKSAAAK